MHQNIKINNTRSIDSKLYTSHYYDYMIYKGETNNFGKNYIDSLAVADFSNLNIIDGRLYSDITWSGATNNGVHMEDIGLTGVDNGFIKFDKDRISNKEFIDILLNSTFDIASGDTRLFMSPITGNTKLYNYPMYLEENGDEKYLKLQGGFYQGFFKLENLDYQVFPFNMTDDWFLHFEIRPRSDYEIGEKTVNFSHSENNGTFFFIGTRAENKFWPLYKTDSGVTSQMKKEYVDEGNRIEIEKECLEWLLDENYMLFSVGDKSFSYEKNNYSQKQYPQFVSTFLNDYGYNQNNICNCKSEGGGGGEDESGETYTCLPEGNNKAIENAYVMKDVEIDIDSLVDSEGYKLKDNGYYEIETDNKFILFDRTKTGFTVDNYDEGTKIALISKKNIPDINYFIWMNRTKTGFTVDNIEEFSKEHGKNYDLYKDIRSNVFSLRITEDGAIGYRFGILNCESENKYELIQEYSKPGIVKYDEWNSINVRFAMIGSKEKCDFRPRKMRIMIYVNGFLKLISKELDSFVFKPLDEMYQKQEGVPYNISLGGGSIGLAETILPTQSAIPQYILPIERDFCGTFIGDIKSFKMYIGFIDYSCVRNYLS